MTDYQNNPSYQTCSALFSSNTSHGFNNLKKSSLINQNVYNRCSNDNFSKIPLTSFPNSYIPNDTPFLMNRYQDCDTGDSYRDLSSFDRSGCNIVQATRLSDSDENPKTSQNLDSTDLKVYPWMKKNHGCNDFGKMSKKKLTFFLNSNLRV